MDAVGSPQASIALYRNWQNAASTGYFFGVEAMDFLD
jgi:hypothetical protein